MDFNFSFRLKQELETLMKDECQSYHKSLGTFTFKFHEPPTHPNCVAWLGGESHSYNTVAIERHSSFVCRICWSIHVGRT